MLDCRPFAATRRRWRRVKAVQASLLVVAVACGGSNTPAEGDVRSFADHLEAVIPDLLAEYGVPGVSVALVDDGKLVWSQGFGVANATTGARVGSDTVFRAASISKTVTALAVLKLVDDGRIDLDAPANQYLSNWQLPSDTYDSEGVTVRRLLSHNAGLSLGYVPYYDPSQSAPSLIDFLSGTSGQTAPVEIVLEPGSGYLYSGGGYLVLQLLIEDVTGSQFSAWVESEILTPLGMTNSSFDNQRPTGSASGHRADESKVDPYVYVGLGAAGLQTTAEDMGRLIANLTSPTERGIGPVTATVSEMITTPAVATEQPGVAQGLGVFLDQRPGVTLAGHAGEDTGWSAKILFAPELHSGIAILTNSDNGTQLHVDIGCRWAAWTTEQTIDQVCP